MNFKAMGSERAVKFSLVIKNFLARKLRFPETYAGQKEGPSR